MIYADGVPMNPNGQVAYCPRCKTSLFSDDKLCCPECGISLYNHCEQQHPNRSNARFCCTCGKPTLYYQEGLLADYSSVLKYGVIPASKIADDTYARYIEMCIATGDRLMTADDFEEFREYMTEEAYVDEEAPDQDAYDFDEKDAMMLTPFAAEL